MSVRVGTGITADDAGTDSFAEAAARAALALGGAPCNLALVFAGPENLEHVEEGLSAVEERLHPGALVGCAAQGVVGDAREVESGGVLVWAASLPGAAVEPFHLEATATAEGTVVSGFPELSGADAAILLADPYSFPAEPLLAEIAGRVPGVPLIGGIASGGSGPAALMLDGAALAEGAVGVVLRGTRMRARVSQGARPIGPEMAITAGEGNVIEELASRPALERLKQAIAELDPHEQALAAQGLLLGMVIDPNKPDYGRGDFLVRGIMGADESTGALTVGAPVRVGQTVQLQVRDAESAHEDLVEALQAERASLRTPPAGALLFTCNGRGSHMFGTAGHDARAVADAFAGAPTGGFFCAGEIGPVGDRSYLHGFTATVAVFPAD